MTLTGILLAGIGLTLVSYAALLPVLIARQKAKNTRQAAENSDKAYTAQDLRARFQLLLSSIHDLDFDYDMGKISAQVYAEQRKMLIGRSVGTLMQLDKAEAHLLELDNKIEVALEKRRDQLTEHPAEKHAKLDAQIEATVAAKKRKKAVSR